jgi:tRNA(Phe) wybutosine-synthesizing methylase Tyw3
MITQQEMQILINQVNEAFGKYETRIQNLEDRVKALEEKPAPKTRAKAA